MRTRDVRCKNPNRCELMHCEHGHHMKGTEVECVTCKAEGRCDECGDIHDPKKITCNDLAHLRAAESACWDASP